MNYISIQSSKDVIEHFGIKGMKWGNRRSKKKFSSSFTTDFNI